MQQPTEKPLKIYTRNYSIYIHVAVKLLIHDIIIYIIMIMHANFHLNRSVYKRSINLTNIIIVMACNNDGIMGFSVLFSSWPHVDVCNRHITESGSTVKANSRLLKEV